MPLVIHDSDLGWKKLQDVAGKTVMVKVQSVARNSSRKMYGWFVENGTRRMIGRHYTAQMLEAHGKYIPQMGKVMDRVIAGTDMQASAEQFGADVASDMRRTIEELGLVGEGKPEHLRDKVKSAAKIGPGRFKRGTWT